MRNNKKLKRMYHFEGRIIFFDGYYISRDVLRVAMITIFRVVSHTEMDVRTHMSPVGPRQRDNECVSLG